MEESGHYPEITQSHRRLLSKKVPQFLVLGQLTCRNGGRRDLEAREEKVATTTRVNPIPVTYHMTKEKQS